MASILGAGKVEGSMRAVICAAGSGSRWNHYLGTRKHLAPIDGEPILHRTVRLLRECGITDIRLTYHPEHPYTDVPGVTHTKATFTPEATTARKMTWPWWADGGDGDGLTLLMLGDVFYTADAIRIMTTPIEGWHQFGRLRPSATTGKPGAEMYGWQFHARDHREFIAAIEAVDAARSQGVQTHVDWSLYSHMTGHDISTPPSEIRDWGRHVEIPDDGTDDFDFPDDYERFMFTFLLRSARRVWEADFHQPWFHARLEEMGLVHKLHRKPWEFAAIAQAVRDRYQTGRPGLRAIGFGVGKEPLPAWLAAQGFDVVATDRPDPGVWLERQHSRGFDDLRRLAICPEETFRQRVTYEALDMNAIPEHHKQGQYDLTWSAGTFEHLGGIDQGLAFFREQMKCLRPGGIAIHTTEYNFADNVNTINSPDICVFRQRDLLALTHALQQQGDRLWPIDLRPGTTAADLHVDQHPYQQEPHLSMAIGPCAFTSVLLIAARGI